MADQTEELEKPTGLGISGLDVPQETQPALLEGQGGAVDLVTEEDTDEPRQHNEPLEFLTNRIYAPEGRDDPPLDSAFPASPSENDEDADDEGAEQGDDEIVLGFQATSNGLWQPHLKPYRTVLGFAGNDDEIYRPNPRKPTEPFKLHPDSDSDPEERKQIREVLRVRRKVAPHKVVRPSPLRTASSPDSPVSPKNMDSTGDVGILPEPSPEIQDEDVVSPLSDRDSTSRPSNPAPPVLPRFASGYDWSQESEVDPAESLEDTDWYKEAIATQTGSRRASEINLEQTPADAGDGALSDQQPISPVSPIDPGSEAGNGRLVYVPDDVHETFHQPEASEYETATVSESFAPVFVGAEDSVYPTEAQSPMSPGSSVLNFNGPKQSGDPPQVTSPTSPDRYGPELLTGLTPQQGIEAWWAWREQSRPMPQPVPFRTNRNLGNRDDKGDLDGKGDLLPNSDNEDVAEAAEYLKAQRLNAQQEHIKEEARHSHYISEAIKFDLKSTQEYIKLRMLKYRFERNKFELQFIDSEQRVGRREQHIDGLNAENREIKRQFDKLYAEYDRMVPILQEEREKRQRLKTEYQGLKAEYQEQAEMSEAYIKAAQSSGEEIRHLRAKLEKQAEPQQSSSTMEVPPQEPASDTSEKPQSDTNDKPKSDVDQQAKKSKRAPPQQFASIMEVFSRKPVSNTNDSAKRIAKRVEKTKQAMRLHLKEFSAQESALDQTDNASQHPKSAPPTYHSRRSPPPPLSPNSPSNPRTRRPAPEHEANWPLADRPPLVDFMTQWINKHRESRQPNDVPHPLQKAQLDKILGVGFLSWDQLIKELLKLGHTIRPDHLAQALADPKNVSIYNLPQPNTAVLYEARRLKKHNAVKELMDEVLDLQRQLRELRMPQDFREDLRHTTSQKEYFKKEAKDLEQETERLNGELDKAWEEIERLRKALSDSCGIEDFGSQADQEEIRRLRNTHAGLQAELEETQQTLSEVLSNRVHPDSPLPLAPPESQIPTDTVGKILLLHEERLTLCQERGLQLSLQNGKLEEDLEAARVDVDDLTQKLSDSRANYTSLNKKSGKKIASLEAKLATCNSSQAGDVKSPSTIEAKLAACHEHGQLLKSNVDDLTRRLSDSREKIADMEAKLAAHDDNEASDSANYQDVDATSDWTQVEALKKKVLELEQELAASRSQSEQLSTREKELRGQLDACRSRGKKLQDRIEQLELELEVQGMQQQGNAGSSSDFLDRVKAAEEYAKDLQEKVDELLLQLDEAKKNTPRFSPEYKEKRLSSIKETKAHRNSIDIQLIAKSEESNAALKEALKEAEKKILALQEQAKSHEEPLPADEPTSDSPGPAVEASGESEDVASLRRELVEAHVKNEKIGPDMFFLQNDLSAARENLKISHEQVKPEQQEEPAPANERSSGSPSQGVEDDDAPLQAGRARPVSADGSVADLEKFVFNQSDGDSEEDSKDCNTGSSSDSSDVGFVVDSKSWAPPSMPEQELHVASPEAPPIKRESTVDKDDVQEDECEHAEDLADANAWLQMDNKSARKTIRALEEELKKLRRQVLDPGVKTTLPSASEPSSSQAQSQQSPPAIETETETRTATQIPRSLPAARQPVPLPEEPSRAPETMSADQIGRLAAMHQSPTHIADAERRRVIRERESEEQHERIRLICRRAAAIFGEEDLPYVPVEKRYKPMARV